VFTAVYCDINSVALQVCWDSFWSLATNPWRCWWCTLYLLDRASLWQLKNKRPTWCHLLFYFTSYVLNMFRTLIYPSSGACDFAVELPHLFFLFSVRCVLEIWCGWVWVVSVLQAEAQLCWRYFSWLSSIIIRWIYYCYCVLSSVRTVTSFGHAACLCSIHVEALSLPFDAVTGLSREMYIVTNERANAASK